MIITFEGGEGAGKTTQTALLKAFLENKGRQVITLREPGGSFLSEKIRALFLETPMDVMTELLLLLASRRENLAGIIAPAVQAGKDVIIDRWIDSTLVYQGLQGGIGIAETTAIMHATRTWLLPDLTFVLDLDPRHARSRFTPGDRFEQRDEGWHGELRKGFLELACETRHHVIDAACTADEVHKAIILVLEEFLN
jgi:dTMP kinase